MAGQSRFPLDHRPRVVRLSVAEPQAVTHFSEADLGEHLVKDEVADFAVAKGYATEGKVDGSPDPEGAQGSSAFEATKKDRPLPRPPTLSQAHQWVTRRC
jgi:hypothetical protein